MAPNDLYDDDDLYDGDDYDGEAEELSPDDKAAMEQGTADVKVALGSDAIKVTAKQIQEALWHYYYDVNKSVAYLTKTFITPPQKPTPKKAPESKLREFSFSSTLGLFVRSSEADPEISRMQVRPMPPTCAFDIGTQEAKSLPSYELDFSDMPWLNIPSSRQATFIAPPQLRGGLLGGSEGRPKMSKLQALAAARKKRTEEKKDQEKASQAESGLKRLSIADDSQKENSKVSQSPAKRQKGEETRGSGASTSLPRRGSKGAVQGRDAVQGREAHPAEITDISVNQELPPIARITTSPEEITVPKTKAPPSAFAQTLFGSTSDSRHANRPQFYSMPYASSSSFLATAFSEPSPDDVVLAAQAKGSNFARAK